MTSSIGTRLDGVLHFDFDIAPQDVDKKAKVMIGQLKKEWDLESIGRKEFSGGISNKLIGYFTEGSNKNPPKYFGKDRSDVILVRLYGEKTELIINRDQELKNLKELSRAGIAPKLYCTFNNGYCYGFVEGTVCVPESFTEEKILQKSAVLMAQIHTMNLSESYLNHYQMKSTIFEWIKQYINLMPRKFDNPDIQERYVKNVPSPEKLLEEVEALEKIVSTFGDMSVSFCHNDLLVANYIFDEDKDKLNCIDFEYGCPNFSAYDIGNHFNEFCGVDEVRHELYPSKKTQLAFLKSYLEKVNELKGIKSNVTDKQLQEWYVHVDHMSLASNLFWGIWAQIQAYHSSIDFDFMGYGIIRLTHYFSRKGEVYANSLH